MSEQLINTLKDKQVELTKRVAAIEADFKKGRSADFSEQTTESENDEVLDEILQEAKTELSLVKNAISKLQQGHYGICESCDDDINPERLKALPYTTTCIKCAK
ncbi:TraR/DksA C4-type zinc finger protein [Thalassotalea sp. SU-HH00458]|uniref:TraR/DksA family transcriptional regulator n=1 Tax=Thalassotalea sp. SU-HH00458 TaxID=3127657 RepID=UPI00310B7CD8